MASPSEVWRPLGEATTQEDEGHGPTAEGVVPVRMRGATAAPAARPMSAASAPQEPEPFPPARAPLRTSAGTEILRGVGRVRGGRAAASPRAERTRGGLRRRADAHRDRDCPARAARIAGLSATPLDLLQAGRRGAGARGAAARGRRSGDARREAGRAARIDPSVPRRSRRSPRGHGQRPRPERAAPPRWSRRGYGLGAGAGTSRGAMPLAHVASVAAAAPLASSATEVRTTSGHLMTLAPSAPRVRSSRAAWAAIRN